MLGPLSFKATYQSTDTTAPKREKNSQTELSEDVGSLMMMVVVVTVIIITVVFV